MSKDASIKIRLTNEQKIQVQEQAERVNLSMSEYVLSLIQNDSLKFMEQQAKLSIRRDLKRLRTIHNEVRYIDVDEIEEYTDEIEEYREIAERWWKILDKAVPETLEGYSDRRISYSSPSKDAEAYYLSKWKNVSKEMVVELLREDEAGRLITADIEWFGRMACCIDHKYFIPVSSLELEDS